jgi:hypothetical protein
MDLKFFYLPPPAAASSIGVLLPTAAVLGIFCRFGDRLSPTEPHGVWCSHGDGGVAALSIWHAGGEARVAAASIHYEH